MAQVVRDSSWQLGMGVSSAVILQALLAACAQSHWIHAMGRARQIERANGQCNAQRKQPRKDTETVDFLCMLHFHANVTLLQIPSSPQRNLIEILYLPDPACLTPCLLSVPCYLTLHKSCHLDVCHAVKL